MNRLSIEGAIFCIPTSVLWANNETNLLAHEAYWNITVKTTKLQKNLTRVFFLFLAIDERKSEKLTIFELFNTAMEETARDKVQPEMIQYCLNIHSK